MINFRMCNNYLPIEKLRWAGIDRDHRKGNSCDKRDIGDDFHYVVVRFSLTQEEVCYFHVISNIQIVLFLRTF